MAAAPSILQIETATISAWPSIKAAHDGLWLWRFARGYSKRANSIQCLDPTDDGDAAARLGRMAELSAAHRLVPTFRVTPLAGPGVIAALDAAGWAAFEESRVLVQPMITADFEVGPKVRQFNPADRDWYGALAELADYPPATVEIFRALMLLIPHDARGFLAYGEAGTPVAAGLAVNANGIGVYLNIVTEAAMRRRGYGRAVVQAALNWTRDNGAHHAAIQVLGDNLAALALYRSLGFEEVYRYHYRRP